MRLDESRRCDALAWWLCGGITLVTILTVVGSQVVRDFNIVTQSRYDAIYPNPVYPSMPLPPVSSGAVSTGVAGADFGQVYTSVLALRQGESAYRSATPAFQDPFRRVKGYPPVTNWLYLPLSFLPYKAALLAHSLLTFCCLLVADAWILWRSGRSRFFWPVCASTLGLYALTPIGLTHLERGQFELLVAAAVALCAAGSLIHANAYASGIADGLLGAMKWTAVPFLLCFSGLGVLCGSRRTRRAYLVLAITMLVATCAFWGELHEYMAVISVHEIHAAPRGLTLQYFLPRWAARLAPILITAALACLIYFRAKTRETRVRLFGSLGAPFSLALIATTICFGTRSFEYHTVAMLGLIPVLVVWATEKNGVPWRAKSATCLTYGVFLCFAFRVFTGTQVFGSQAMTAAYCVFAVAQLAICVSIVLSPAPALSDSPP